MPFASEAQKRLFFAAASGKATKADLSPQQARSTIKKARAAGELKVVPGKGPGSTPKKKKQRTKQPIPPR